MLFSGIIYSFFYWWSNVWFNIGFPLLTLLLISHVTSLTRGMWNISWLIWVSNLTPDESVQVVHNATVWTLKLKPLLLCTVLYWSIGTVLAPVCVHKLQLNMYSFQNKCPNEFPLWHTIIAAIELCRRLYQTLSNQFKMLCRTNFRTIDMLITLFI